MQIRLAFKNSDVLVFDKPAGLPVHEGTATKKTLTQFIIKKYPEIKNVGPSASLRASSFRPGIVHRLDKDTSGVLIVARNQNSFLHLKKEFKERRAKKVYLALVYGIVKKDKDIIARKISRSKKDFRKKGIFGEGREAITRFEVLKRFKDFTLLKVMPETGRQHQIRIHLASIGHPIVGDRVYGFKRQKPHIGLSRQFLHAYSLTIKLPSNETKTFQADLPKDLKNILRNLEKIRQ